MAPVTSVRSVRLQNELWARIAAEADKRGVAVNGLVSDLLEVALLKAAEKAAEPEPAADNQKGRRAKLAKVQKAANVQFRDDVEVEFLRRITTGERGQIVEVSMGPLVQIGPTRAKYGERAKKGPKT